MRFVIQQDRTTGDFEIVARRNKKRFVVQRNIRTYLKAKTAQRFWRGMKLDQPGSKVHVIGPDA